MFMKSARGSLFLSLAIVLVTPSICASAEKTIRICDDTGCSDRPRNHSSFDPSADNNPEETRRLDALKDVASKDPRAAFDLGLRFFRGDGVRQDSYQALVWMRDAAERGDLRAQVAVGRFYLMGLEEMGSDPAEAEKWLSIAAGRGDKDAEKLLAEARKARKDDIAYRRWLQLNRSIWYGYWAHGYPYRWIWRGNHWYYP